MLRCCMLTLSLLFLQLSHALDGLPQYTMATTTRDNSGVGRQALSLWDQSEKVLLVSLAAYCLKQIPPPPGTNCPAMGVPTPPAGWRNI
jgi:hypothetical protein